MADEKVIPGRVRLRPTATMKLSYEFAEPVEPLKENVATFEIAPWHLEQGIPKDGPA